LAVRIHHVNIRTRDLEGTIAFYTEAVGLTNGYRPNFNFPGAWLYDVAEPVVHVNLVPHEPDRSQNAFDHVAFAFDALDPVLARLDRLKIPYGGLKAVPGSDLRQCFVIDPNGVTVELQGP